MQGVSLEVTSGSILAVIGMNGSGKSTLLKCLNGLLKPRSGIVMLDGKNLNKMKREEIAKHVGYVPQRYHEGDLTVFDAVLLGRKPHIYWSPSDYDFDVVNYALQAMEIERYALRPVRELSGGEIQRVMLARAIAQEPKVLLLDEPTSSLDLYHQIEVMNLLYMMAKDMGMAIIFSMHDINLALQFADRFLLLKEGKVYAYGGLEIITPQNIEDVFKVEVSLTQIGDHILVTPLLKSKNNFDFAESVNLGA
ncbi:MULTISPECIES: ABC transporter ATP-binding protein [Acetomicrobium]|uniref:ABC transporter ATP-binding protein n=1 Tax=Acetomicrobium TaxID=49894 RepID=UPI0026EA500F|nr:MULTISPECIES: ABC transporter ATP-binding protein [Acetomicrobium]MDI9376893.1 ABC transporter ATP-binding protein [Synergistota bacterium]HOB10191.1 ABC transporter ATP-binding protein [Acetomicrobium sp.]HPT64636.1 ABC transporter ATP-binding protein [Acetomicrobium sp.]HQA37038.1 ABC transporter ATP-binding protein [Acetomicrobium sp.]HQC87758.1 ABC transporter ATP-binding protein [Acetomicrobium sp.]